ncbi:MAG: cytochrome P450 [Solirubrobacterales bacterium]
MPRKYRGAELPPTIHAPGIGVGLLYLLGRPDLATRIGTRKGPAATLEVPGFGLSVAVASPEFAKQVYTAAPDVLHSGESSPLKRTLGKHSIFALDEDEHLRERRLLLPPFHGERMGAYTRIFEEEALAEFETWKTGDEFPTLEPMMRITLNAILRAVFGAEDEEFEGLREVIPPLVKVGSAMTALPALQKDLGSWSPWTRFLAHRARYDELVNTLVDKGHADPQLAERNDVLALLLQARYDDGEAMTRAQIADELLTILVAGHETTAGTLAWAVERLRRHPDLLDRLIDEANAGGSKLREATIWELQRVRPVIVATERLVVKPFELGEWTIPPRMHVVVDFLGLHNDPELFPDPLALRPERFLEAAPDTYSWVPFGGGRRRCAGAAFAKLEMDVVLRMLLTRCTWKATDAKDERWRFRGVAFVPAKGGRGEFSAIDCSPLAAPQDRGALVGEQVGVGAD